MSVPVTLSDLERWDVRGQISQRDLLNNARTVLPRTTNNQHGNTCGEEAYISRSRS